MCVAALQSRKNVVKEYNLSSFPFSVNLNFQAWFPFEINRLYDRLSDMKMNMDKFMPHREPMRLVKKVVDLGENWAITECVVTKKWPLCQGDSVSPIVLLELVAQTATVFLGWRKSEKEGEDCVGKGWLVGIREAVFHCGKIDVNSILITDSREIFEYDNYHEITGTTTKDGNLLGKVTLQVIEAE